MPMYYPDLASVQRDARIMSKHIGNKKYHGIIPQTEAELPMARKQLAQYFREIWNDEIQAMEIELAVTQENYDIKMNEAVMKKFLEINKQPL